MNTVQGVIDKIYRIPRKGIPNIIAEVVPGKPTALRLMLVFRAGETYCCSEPGCHLGLHDLDIWNRIIPELRKANCIISDHQVIKVIGIVQAGAQLECNQKVIASANVDKAEEYVVEYHRPSVDP
jgi:hypothetical protein